MGHWRGSETGGLFQWILEVLPVYAMSSKGNSLNLGFSSSRSTISPSTLASESSSPRQLLPPPQPQLQHQRPSTNLQLTNYSIRPPETRFSMPLTLFLSVTFILYSKCLSYDFGFGGLRQRDVFSVFSCQKAEETGRLPATSGKWVNDKGVDGWDGMRSCDLGTLGKACLTLGGSSIPP